MKSSQKLLSIITILLLGVIIWWHHGTSAVNARDTSQVIFTVPKGSSVKAIAQHLKEQHLITSPTVFYLLVKQLGLDGKIQAGDFKLSPSQSPASIAKTLTTGTLDIWITIPEGYRAEEIADTLQEKMPSYSDNWRLSLNNNEGYLFPDTYLFPRDADIQTIVTIMKNNFDKKYTDLSNHYSSPYSREQIVTIASMIEREARTPTDQKLVGSVILNRLQQGMALQLDATIQYAIGTPAKWWPMLPDSGSNVVPNSPYNTYTHVGLPPTPIANPGSSALEAVLNPAQSNYLYYITDNHGKNHYARTLDEHEANIKLYGL